MMDNTKTGKFILIAGCLLLALLIFNSFFVFSLSTALDTKIEEAKELARPATLELVSIQTSCSECFDINPILSKLMAADLDIQNERTISADSQEAKELVSRYAIETLPTILAFGEVDRAKIQNFEKVEDALVFQGVTAPYVNSLTSEIEGLVSSFIIQDASCEACSDYALSISSLEQSGVTFGDQAVLDYSSPEAKQLLLTHNITKVPALILSDDLDAYPEMRQNFAQSGLLAKQGYYVIESSAPFVEADTGKTRGLVKLSLLSDESCIGCYDVETHSQILSRFGLAIEDEQIIDILSSEGQSLKNKYAILQVPTALITGDLEVYDGFKDTWETVGTVESDGTYVFRDLSALGQGITYNDLSSGETITVSSQG